MTKYVRVVKATGAVEGETERAGAPVGLEAPYDVKGWRWLEVLPVRQLAAWEREGGLPATADPAGTSVSRQVVVVPLADWKARRIAKLRAEAGDRITAFAPTHLQLNCLARASELAFKLADTGSLTSDEQAEAATLRAMFSDHVNPVRAACNAAEAAIDAAEDHAAVETAFSGVQWP